MYDAIDDTRYRVECSVYDGPAGTTVKNAFLIRRLSHQPGCAAM
jgi:hypothetical protein